MTTRRRTAEEAAAEMVEFFRELGPESRREYEALAALDREYGEDVLAERRARATGERS